MKIVIGLGNPGSKYDGTRHNIGFEVIDYLAKGPGVGSSRSAFHSTVTEATEGTDKVLLVKPETYMNLSGRAVRAILDFYKLTPAEILVICDDLNLPVGKIRVRSKGSSGGQNGLKNIQEMIGTDEYARLRIGVGQPAPGRAVDYVLGRFSPGERRDIEDAVAASAQAVMVWIRQGVEACMNSANGAGNGKGNGNVNPPAKKPRKSKPNGSDLPNDRVQVEPTRPRAEPD